MGRNCAESPHSALSYTPAPVRGRVPMTLLRFTRCTTRRPRAVAASVSRMRRDADARTNRHRHARDAHPNSQCPTASDPCPPRLYRR